jgi:predicted nucleic acid-binding protein
VNYLLDTNVVSEWIRPRPTTSVVTWLAQANEDELFLSVCTLAELHFGVATMPKGKRRNDLEDWLRNDLVARFDRRVVPIDMAIAAAWGEISASARRKGRPIDAMDGLIAATAEVHAMTVVTRDVRDFETAGVTLLNPWGL